MQGRKMLTFMTETDFAKHIQFGKAMNHHLSQFLLNLNRINKNAEMPIKTILKCSGSEVVAYFQLQQTWW